MEKRAEHNVVSSKNLSKAAADSKEVRAAVGRRMQAEGWRNDDAKAKRIYLISIFIAAVAFAVFGAIVGIAAETGFTFVGVAALAALAVTALVFFGLYPTLSVRGQEAALPWRAYREGLKHAAKDEAATLDLNAVLADAVAMNLGSAMEKRLKAANESGEALSAFTSPQGRAFAATFPWWVAFNSSVATSSGTGGVVSGGGAGGGGGAAGST